MKYTLKVRALSSSYFAGHDTDEYVRGAIRDLFDEDRKGLKNAIVDCDITKEDVSDDKRNTVVSFFEALGADNIFDKCSFGGTEAFKLSGWEPVANGNDVELFFSVEITIDIRGLYDEIDLIMKDIDRKLEEDAMLKAVLEDEETEEIEHRHKAKSRDTDADFYSLMESIGA